MAKSDGGPAFPKTDWEWNDDATLWPNKEHPGMSLRDHFATHAPLVQEEVEQGSGEEGPPTWFDFPAYDGPMQPQYKSPYALEQMCDEEKKKYDNEDAAWRKAVNDHLRRRFFAWRWYYADQMLKEREK